MTKDSNIIIKGKVAVINNKKDYYKIGDRDGGE